MNGDQAAYHRIVHSLDDEVDEAELDRPRDRRSVTCPTGSHAEERDTGKLARERRGSHWVVPGRGDVDECGVHERLPEERAELVRSAGDEQTAVTPRSGPARDGANALSGRIHGDDRRPERADRGGRTDGHAGRCSASRPSTIVDARRSTARAFAYEIISTASSIATHLHAVMPSSRCGFVDELAVSIK